MIKMRCLVIFTLSLTVVVAQNCNLELAAQCVDKQQPQTSNKDYGLILTSEMLNQICSWEREKVTCVDKIKGCTNEYLGPIKRRLTSINNFIRDFCEDGSNLKKDFLKNVNCLSSLAEEITACIRNSSQGIPEDRITTPEMTLERKCRGLHNNLTCITDTIKPKCGVEAADNTKMLHTSATPVELQDMCISPKSGKGCRVQSSENLILAVLGCICLFLRTV